jgi:hypothetical protein
MPEIRNHITGGLIFELTIEPNARAPLYARYIVREALKAGISLIGADLPGADLSDGNFDFAVFVMANLIGADLSSAHMSGANLVGANLTGADLRGADLGQANLTGANLTGAYLTGADLSGATLIGAKLVEAELCDADLSFANLTGADLTRANLEKANLAEANLIGTSFLQMELRGACIGKDFMIAKALRPVFTVGPLGRQATYLTAFLTTSGIRVQTGGAMITIDEFRAAISGNFVDGLLAQEYLSASRLIEEHFEHWPAEPLSVT